MTTLDRHFVLVSPMIDEWRNSGSVTISIWTESNGSKHATIHDSCGCGQFRESIESARIRYAGLIKKNYKLKAD
jgi:hypothetical protein